MRTSSKTAKPKKNRLGQLRFALIGVGKFGKNHLRVLRETNHISLEMLATKTAHSAQDLKVLPKERHVLDAKEILNNPEIDCVVIASPSKTHFAFAKKALEKGKCVLVEKPLTTSLKEAKELERIAKKSGQVLMVGFQYIFNDHLRYLKKELEKGALGKIEEFSFEHSLSMPRKDINCFWDTAPHALSIFQYLFSPTKIIKASGKIQKDSAELSVRFDRGPLFSLAASWNGKEKVRKISFLGKEGSAELDETKTKQKLLINKNGKTSFAKVAFKEPLKNQFEHFIECVHKKKDPLTNAALGVKISEWLEMIPQKIKSK